MNIKKQLVAKKNIVNILSLILTGTKTNKEIAETLNKSQSTISEHLSPLQKEGIVFIWENKRYNKKEYEVNCEKIAEIFFMKFLKKKEFTKYKNNDFVALTFAWIISIKKDLMKKEPKKFDKVSLYDIFAETLKYFYYRGKAFVKGNENLALEGYRTDKEKTKSEFKEFLKLIYGDMQKRLENEEQSRLKEGEELVRQIRFKKF
ncbi:winged helix-turn-helix transcriptional regulator [Candidatus Pacearchaeota archaeon]|nr:winged helix-turn-helix transcriptional regulator [Candidatus Pacearchaeota archaeon]